MLQRGSLGHYCFGPAPISEKLWKIRSRLYRGRKLRSITRWTRLGKIYQIKVLLHLSKFKMSVFEFGKKLLDHIKNYQKAFFCSCADKKLEVSKFKSDTKTLTQ